MNIKKMNMAMCLLVAFFFTACTSNDDPKATVTYNYEFLFNGDSEVDLTPEPSDGLNQLSNFYEDKTNEITSKIKTKNFSIKGEGDTKAEAQNDADEKATTKFNSYVDELNADVEKFKEDFLAKRTELASKIKVDNPDAHVKYRNVGPFLRRKKAETGIGYIIIAKGDAIDKIEAIGGEDYSK